MFYIFHGEDEFGRAEEMARLRGQMAGGDAAMADLNTSVLDGNRLTMSELHHACDAIPFMADRRLVIVRGLLARLSPGAKDKGSRVKQGGKQAWGKRAFLAELATYLPLLPPTTRLFFVEGKTLPPSHPILKVAQAEDQKGRGFVKHFKLPKDRELPGWIRQRARDKGGEIKPQAVTLLAALVGNDLRLLDQEIEKLLLYCAGRPTTLADVRTLVSRAREASIFDMVDCVGQRQADRALRLLHGLLEDGREPLYVLAMLARQVRILIQVSELGGKGLTKSEIAKQLKLHPFVVGKGLTQARNFNMAQLEAAHACLVRTDWLIKSGKMDDVLALDTLVVDLTQV